MKQSHSCSPLHCIFQSLSPARLAQVLPQVLVLSRQQAPRNFGVRLCVDFLAWISTFLIKKTQFGRGRLYSHRKQLAPATATVPATSKSRPSCQIGKDRAVEVPPVEQAPLANWEAPPTPDQPRSRSFFDRVWPPLDLRQDSTSIFPPWFAPPPARELPPGGSTSLTPSGGRHKSIFGTSEKRLYGHREQLNFFRAALDVPTRAYGPFVPQPMFQPHTVGDYAEEAELEPPIFFCMDHPSEFGIPLTDALYSRVQRLQIRDIPVFEGHGPSVSIRLEVCRHFTNQRTQFLLTIVFLSGPDIGRGAGRFEPRTIILRMDLSPWPSWLKRWPSASNVLFR